MHDQLYKIHKSLKISKGDIIFLLDGDDTFYKKKVEILNKMIKFEKIMILDNFYISENYKKFKKKPLDFKKNYFFRKILNDWPKNVCTSAITINKELLIKFYNEINFRKYKYLAIDILLAIYSNKKQKLIKTNQFLTQKIEVNGSLDKNFIGLSNKFYWFRRLEQHNYNFSFGKKNYLSFDYLISFIFSFFFKKLI